MSKAKATTGPNDPVSVLDQSCTRIDALHTEVSSTGLFNLVWTGKWPDLKPNNRVTQIEDELAKTDGIIVEANSYTQKLMQICIRLRDAAEALSVLIGKKMEEEYKTINWDINGRYLTDGEYKKMFICTQSWERFEAIRKQLVEMSTAANEVAENPKLASAMHESTKLISSFWEKNKDQMKNVQKLLEEKLRQKKEEIARLEEERQAKERERKERESEERERREREKKEREERERLEREEREQLKRLEKKRSEEERKAKEREKKEREKAERERREREKKEREERERLEREERERFARERLAREEQERLKRARREKEERERKARVEKERKERERKQREAREKAEREEMKRRKKEEEEQRLRLEEQRRKEEAEREKRDPNSKFWRSLFYNAQEETKKNKGLCCVFRAFTDSLVRSEISVTEVPFLRANVTIGSGEELASIVLDIRSENGRLEYPYPARLAMPNLVGRHNFFTAIAKVRVDDSSEWTTVPSKETNIDKYKDLAECELPPFTRIRLAILRAVTKDSKVIRRGGGTVRSNIEPRVSIEFPKDAVQDPREITILICHVDHTLIETLKRHSQGCDNVTTASHVLHVENLEDLGRLKVPLKVTMPAVDCLKKNKQDKTPPIHTLVIQLSPNGQWTICRKVDAEPNEEGVVTVMSSNPVSGMVVMGMATNSKAEAEFAAERLNRHLDEHVIKFIQKQSDKDRSQIVTDCVNTEDSDDRLSDLEKKGYTVGCSPSKEILIREGQAFKMMLSQRGNLRRTGFRKDAADAVIEFVYYSNLKCSKKEFSVEADNIYGQISRDFYFGHNEYFTQGSSGTKAEKIHDFEIKLPKTNREKSIVKKAPRIFGAGALDEKIFKLIAASLEEGEWTRLASRLNMDKAKIARIEKDNSGNGLEQTIFAILWDWYKKTEVSGNKVENLCHSLRKINKYDIAYHIEQENNKVLEEQQNEAKGANLTTAFFIVKESENVLRNWKMIGRHLGVSEGDVAAIDIDVNDEVDGIREKLWKVLNAWKDQDVGGATIDKLIAVMRKMEINLVAENLERLIPMSDRNTAGPSRPTTAQRPKTAGRSNSGLSPRGIVSRPSTVQGSRR